jgi:hypothetical protein
MVIMDPTLDVSLLLNALVAQLAEAHALGACQYQFESDRGHQGILFHRTMVIFGCFTSITETTTWRLPRSAPQMILKIMVAPK